MNYDSMPIPPQLDDAPELAVLAVLDTALEASALALFASDPGLYDDWRVRPRVEPQISAYRLLSRIGKLQVAVARYREEVLREPPPALSAAPDLDDGSEPPF